MQYAPAVYWHARHARQKESDTAREASFEAISRCVHMVKRNLPPGLLPSGLSQTESAGYAGFSDNHYRRLVRKGLMPRPRDADGRLITPRAEIDAALLRLPRLGAVDDPDLQLVSTGGLKDWD